MRTITTILSANSVYYTGVTARRLCRTDRQFVLQPGGRKQTISNVHWSAFSTLVMELCKVKPCKSESAGMNIATKLLITDILRSMPWHLSKKLSSRGAKKMTSSWRNLNWMFRLTNAVKVAWWIQWLMYLFYDYFQIRGNPQVGQDCFVTFSFMNPVSVSLTECEFTFEGPGLVRAQTVKYRWVRRSA